MIPRVRRTRVVHIVAPISELAARGSRSLRARASGAYSKVGEPDFRLRPRAQYPRSRDQGATASADRQQHWRPRRLGQSPRRFEGKRAQAPLRASNSPACGGGAPALPNLNRAEHRYGHRFVLFSDELCRRAINGDASLAATRTRQRLGARCFRAIGFDVEVCQPACPPPIVDVERQALGLEPGAAFSCLVCLGRGAEERSNSGKARAPSP